MKYAQVAFAKHPTITFDYLIPPKFAEKLAIGDKVEVSFRNERKTGYIVGKKNHCFLRKVLPILAHLPEKILTQDLILLAIWMAKYYCTPLSKVLLMMIRLSVLTSTKTEKKLVLFLLPSKEKARLEIVRLRNRFAKRATLLEMALQKKHIFLEEVRAYRPQIKTLLQQKWLGKKELLVENTLFLEQEYFLTKKKTLNEAQNKAYSAVAKQLELDRFQTFLLHGVTGSGKTEVYLQLTEKARSLDKDVLILVPEIALTTQLVEKFQARFSEPIGIIHHKRSTKQRQSDWQKILDKKIHIVLGARSAVFAPFYNLGLIIVDEEHETSYKQLEEMPTYHARDVAIKRASLLDACVVLGSATPCLESYYKAKQGKYTLLSLKKRAVASSVAPIRIIPMAKEYEQAQGFTHFSSELLKKIKERAKKGEQTLLFFNRRGYRTCRICLKCDKPLRCVSCDLSLTWHKKANVMRCHLCHFSMPLPRICPYCNALDMVTYKGFGTEHIQRCLEAVLPEIRTLRMDHDTTKKKGAHEDLFRQFRSGKADVLIGTQMIAKGFHFPAVTLVGILQPERALFLPDFRAPETVFQLITQVAGRAGREELKGEVLIQTNLPQDPTIQLAKQQDYLIFYEQAIKDRGIFLYPPFSRMIKIQVSSPNQKNTHTWAKKLHAKLDQCLSQDTLYPITEPAYEKVCGRYRLHMLLRTQKINQTTSLLKQAVEQIALPASVRILIDVDCVSTL